MTILGILFVVGVAFLATMNFEAGLIASDTARTRTDAAISDVSEQFGGVLRDAVMVDSGSPFSGAVAAQSQVAFAEMPGVHNFSSPIEPYRDDNGTVLVGDDKVYFDGYMDPSTLRSRPFQRSRFAWGFPIDTQWSHGTPQDLDGDGVLETVVDADGDGIVDSIQVDASLLGLGDAQLAGLAQRLNPPSNPNGKVFVGLRVIPHGGLVNLNASHPRLIENVLEIPDIFLSGDPNYGNFYHRPAQKQVAYSPFVDEPMLRRRLFLPPREMSPSFLQGFDPSAKISMNNADMAWQLFPPSAPDYETAASHQYAPFDPAAPFNSSDPDSPPYWAMRMEPFTSDQFDSSPNDGNRPEYDRRHLVTTVSHDDLLSRGGRVLLNPAADVGEDMIALMTQANQAAFDVDSCLPRLQSGISSFPFEYADYPQTIQDDCCPTDTGCKLNARKGHLQLSLPWLDAGYGIAATQPNTLRHFGAESASLTQAHLDRLIYDAFMMLVSNAQGGFWNDMNNCAADADCWGYEKCVIPVGATVGSCRDVVTNQPHRLNAITRTAAALTANMIDFKDFDDPNGDGIDDFIPTRIALRSFDFTHRVCMTQRQLLPPVVECQTDADCPGAKCAHPSEAAGREFDLDPDAGPGQFQPTYVYGLERQPFITEIGTSNETTPPDFPIKARAVEVFNPYETAIVAAGQYFLIEREPNGVVHPAVPLPGNLAPNTVPNPLPFTVFASGTDLNELIGPTANGSMVDLGATALQFETGWTVYLVRSVPYPEGPVNIVVDQVTVAGECLGMQGLALPENPCRIGPGPYIYSRERTATLDRPWTAPVPVYTPNLLITTLGEQSAPNPTLHPVELRTAGTGSFSTPVPTGLPGAGTIAFPTTGSMLMLIRHANRAWADAAIFPATRTPDLAFTGRLDDRVVYKNPTTNVVVATLPESVQIDNGRMPIFERPTTAAGSSYTAHSLPPAQTPQFEPGDAGALPWGQLVFDYFTALPLRNPGPYFDINPTFVALPDSKPRVDMEGLRVHGRININAAPWKVLAGLPLIPMERVPTVFRGNIRRALGFVTDTAVDPLNPTTAELSVQDNQASRIGNEVAQAIVAYRELRSLPGSGPCVVDPATGYRSGNCTGNYDDGASPAVPPPPAAYARGWGALNALARRGTGFMTIGELANVRHFGADPIVYAPPKPRYPKSYDRVDAGFVNAAADGADFIDAIAVLYALGDWVTVRSDVFTVYGVLRGDLDPDITDPDPTTQAKLQARDVDSRAIRFQETIDRLPTVLGESTPVRVGPKTLTRYTDTRND